MPKYALNKSTNTLHLIDGCHHAKREYTQNSRDSFKLFKTEDDAISKHQNHIRYCRICFKDR